MNTKDILNAYLYPTAGDNVRRKSYPYYDTLAIAAGTLEYFFFQTALGNIFLRNKRLPLAGTEVFFVTAISAYIETKISTTALTNAFNEILQQSFLEISVDNRVQCKLPGLDFVNYQYSDTWSDQVVVTAVQPRYGGHVNADAFLGRKLPVPILLNSTSSFQFRFVTTAAAATAFDGAHMRLVLHGVQLDKLDSFYWDNLKNAQYQQVPITYYNTVPITGAGAAVNYSLFSNPAQANNLWSKTFPLSDIVAASIQNIEVFVNQPDTPIEPSTIWTSRLTNVLTINVDEIDMYFADLENMLSVFASFGLVLTTTPNLDVVNFLNNRQSYTLPIPLEIPANSNVIMNIQQPAASLGITGEITVALRGVETRRVA
jgi:hypothetical protein